MSFDIHGDSAEKKNVEDEIYEEYINTEDIDYFPEHKDDEA